MKYQKLMIKSLLFLGVVLMLTSCYKEQSSKTSWYYNDSKWGGFESVPYTEQETGPSLVLIEGGTFVMGRVEQELMYNWDNIPRRISVSSFYMDQTEIANLEYREYLYWLGRVFGLDYPEVIDAALPDTLVWRSKLGYNEPYVEYYLRHPAYAYYPVVGINWVQANQYCSWRTDRVNEYILIREGILRIDPNQQNEENFNTDAYLTGQYEGLVRHDLYDLNPSGAGTRKVRMEDGILLPKYRLPTEAEWEFAALGLIGNTLAERVVERRIYPWNGHGLRNDSEENMGQFVANFKRGRGDNMGVAGNLNDGYDVTAPVFSFWPNDYGLYHMAGNVSEWVLDVYRPVSAEDKDDFRPFRGNQFKTKVLDDDGLIAEKDSLGRVQWREVTAEESASRRNYRYSDNRDFLDGDFTSSVFYYDETYLEPESKNKLMYEFGFSSMINNNSRVYKGASWKDRAYWLSPGTRRFLDQNLSTDYIGFRCVMDRIGDPVGFGY